MIDSGDVDCVAVPLRKGQRLSAEVQAVRLGGEMTDTVLTVLGPDGGQLARWTTRRSPARTRSPRSSPRPTARYTIQVRDTAFGGGPTSTYALHVGDFPRPRASSPGRPGGQRRALEAPRASTASRPSRSSTLPRDAGPWWDYYPTLDGADGPDADRRSGSALIRASTRPTSTEAAPPRPGWLKPHDWPVAFHGVIGGRGDVDAFAIKARAGEVIQVEAFAARIGSPLDSILRGLRPRG